MDNPPDEYFLQELKALFKSGEFLPYNPKDFVNRAYEAESSEEFDSAGSPLGKLKKNLEEAGYRPGAGVDYEDAPSMVKERSVNEFTAEPEFYYSVKTLPDDPVDEKAPFAVPPADPRYFRTRSNDKADLKRAVTNAKALSDDQYNNYYDEKLPADIESVEFEDSFEEPRQQRQNPNLAATKINKIVYPQETAAQGSNLPRSQSMGKLNIDRDIPTSLVPTSPRHQHVIQQALKNSPGYNMDTNLYLYAIIAGIGAAATVAITAFAVGWYTMRKKSKAAVDVEYPAYGVTGPNMDVTPSGDRQLAHSAQMYHYQHQKQQIIAMESRGGIAERNGSVSDAESEDENDEGDYTVYECPGFATTGEMEVKNPLFLDEPTPATPAQQQPATTKPKEK